MTVHHASRQEGGKLGLCPTNNLHGRAIEKNLRLRSGPQYLVGKVVWPVGRIGDAVAVEIERRIVAPIIAAAILRPVEIATAYIFDLVPVVHEGIPYEIVALGSCGKMNADLAALKPVVPKHVAVSIVDEDTFFGPVACALVEREFGTVRWW